MAVETNARIEFSVASVEEWEKVNPKLHQGEPVFAKKPSGKYILKVGAPGGSTYKNAVVVWDQDDAETKMTSTQEAAAQALASKNAASASASAAVTSAENAKTSETNAAASANTAKSWSMSDSSPDGIIGNKSAKTWAEEAKTSASNSANSASASTSSAETASYYADKAMRYAEAPRGQAPNGSTSARLWAETAGSKASDAASSASASASSASNAATSASNAKISETNAANSAAAAAQSAIDAAKFDPSSYYTKTETYTKEEVDNKIANTNPDLSSYYTKAEVDAKIPTKLSQLTDYAQETQKWKDAYNNLRKRSYPTTFDKEELTVLTNTSSDNDGITLSKPYTNFDGLLLEITDTNGSIATTLYVSTEEIEHNKAFASTIANQFPLVNTRLFYICSTQGLSSTFLPRVSANCVVTRVYGVKFKEIT